MVPKSTCSLGLIKRTRLSKPDVCFRIADDYRYDLTAPITLFYKGELKRLIHSSVFSVLQEPFKPLGTN